MVLRSPAPIKKIHVVLRSPAPIKKIVRGVVASREPEKKSLRTLCGGQGQKKNRRKKTPSWASGRLSVTLFNLICSLTLSFLHSNSYLCLISHRMMSRRMTSNRRSLPSQRSLFCSAVMTPTAQRSLGSVEDRGYMVAPLSQRVRRELSGTGGTQRPVPNGIEGSCTKNGQGGTDLIGRCGGGAIGQLTTEQGG